MEAAAAQVEGVEAEVAAAEAEKAAAAQVEGAETSSRVLGGDLD